MMNLVLGWADQELLNTPETQPDMRMAQVSADQVKKKAERVYAENIECGQLIAKTIDEKTTNQAKNQYTPGEIQASLDWVNAVYG